MNPRSEGIPERAAMAWRTLRQLWFIVRSYWQAGPEAREGIMMMAGLTHQLHLHGEDGVEITIMLMPEGSKYGHAGFCGPLDKDGNGYVTKRWGATTETSSGGSLATSQLTLNCGGPIHR